MNEQPASKSQKRAARLFSLAVADGYQSTARVLEAAGLAGDGLGLLTWREAAKLSDEALVAALKSRRDARMDDLVIDR